LTPQLISLLAVDWAIRPGSAFKIENKLPRAQPVTNGIMATPKQEFRRFPVPISRDKDPGLEDYCRGNTFPPG